MISYDYCIIPTFGSPYIADYEKHQPWLQQVIKTSVYPVLGVLFISQRPYSEIPGEYGAIVAGFVSSYMIGAIYFSPLALAIKQITKSNSFNYKLAFSIMLGIFAAIVISLITSNQIAIMVTTSLLVLITIVIFSIFYAKIIFKFICEIAAKKVLLYHDHLDTACFIDKGNEYLTERGFNKGTKYYAAFISVIIRFIKIEIFHNWNNLYSLKC